MQTKQPDIVAVNAPGIYLNLPYSIYRETRQSVVNPKSLFKISVFGAIQMLLDLLLVFTSIAGVLTLIVLVLPINPSPEDVGNILGLKSRILEFISSFSSILAPLILFSKYSKSESDPFTRRFNRAVSEALRHRSDYNELVNRYGQFVKTDYVVHYGKWNPIGTGQHVKNEDGEDERNGKNAL